MQKQSGQKRRHPDTITRSVTHIRLDEANSVKLAALDELAVVYLALCQHYVTYFCTEEEPNKFSPTIFDTTLSERWHRVAIQQAAGIAQSWRANRANAYQDYLDNLLDYHERETNGELKKNEEEPTWQEWNIPALRQTCIQANANVVVLEHSHTDTFDYWLRISTLEKHYPLRVPVKLSAYHREALTDPQTGERRPINSSVTLNKRDGTWWLTLSYDTVVPIQTQLDAPVVGIDVGIANFLTTSTGKHYGSFHKKLRDRQKRDREKRRRKAKLRACLKKKGVKKLPSTSSRSGQRLARHVRQEINRAVNECLHDHQGYQIAYEHLSVRTMKFKARAMNAYLYASNLGHIPEQLVWATARDGIKVTRVNPAYSSQECSVCHYVDRKNRPDQQTFCCSVCGHTAHADENAAINLAHRRYDEALHACKDKHEVKLLLLRRHQEWRERHSGWS
jgi:IS605 OrfB family transposase